MASRKTTRIGSDWYNECTKMISYKGGGIPFNHAKSLLSPYWDEGKQLGLEGDDLCRWVLNEVQPDLDLYLTGAGKPLRNADYYPTGFPQQYGLKSGEKKTLWRYNPIRDFPDLEDLPATTPKDVRLSPSYLSLYGFQSKPTDRTPNQGMYTSLLGPVGPRPAQVGARPAPVGARPAGPRPVYQGAGARPAGPRPAPRY